MNIFIAFANQDRDVRDQLLRQMNLVKDRHGWHIWSAKEIKAGEKWDAEIRQRLFDSEVVILLLSTDFFNSKYIVEAELPEIIAKHKTGNCQIIPVIARLCHWKDTPFGEYAQLGDIQALPVGEYPIISRGYWDNDAQPYFETVKGIRDSIQTFQTKKGGKAAAAKRTEQGGLAAKQHARVEAASQADQERLIRVKELKRKKGKLGAWGWYAALGVAVLLLAWWLVPIMLGDEKTQNGHNQSVPLDTPRPVSTTSSAPTTTFDYPTVRVTGGTFQMGSPDSEAGRYKDECQHQVTVGSFSMGKYEVTQAQWKAIMGDNPANFKGCDNCPVEQVSWNDVQVFLKKLKKKTGRIYRLPTEAEWEYAARDRVKSQGDQYAGSNTLGSIAWYNDNSSGKTHPIGTKSPNELGLYDMSGNVWEWCDDIYKPYLCDSKTTTSSRFRVLRGGSWNNYAPSCRAANRDAYGAADRGGYIGFRLVSVSLQ